MSLSLSGSVGYAPLECLPSRLGRLAVDDVENFDGAVGRTRSKPFTVVVELGVVLKRNTNEMSTFRLGTDTYAYNHVLVCGFDWDRIGGRRADHVVKRSFEVVIL